MLFMMYDGPDRIGKVLHEFSRVAKKGAVLCEWHLEKAGGKGHLYHYGHWIYDYSVLLGRYAPGGSVTVEKIPKEAWADARREKYGHIIRLEFEQPR